MGPVLQALLAASSCAAGIDVRSTGEKTFTVESNGAAVSSVLECLSEKAGFKLVIDSAVSLRQPVTVKLQERTSAQSINSLLEGLPVNVALSSDPLGGRVLMLLITARSGSGSAGGSNSIAAGQGNQGSQNSPFGLGGRPGARPPTGNPAPPPPEPDMDEPGGVSVPYMQQPQFPQYPEAQPLSPFTLRGGRQIHVADARRPKG